MEQHVVSTQQATAERFAVLARIGTALMSELDEARLLRLIAETACDLTGAAFAAFTLRTVNEEGEPIAPSEGNLFHLAAVVGVTHEQEALFQRISLGGGGLLTPIFHHGVPMRVPDALALLHRPEESPISESREAARQTGLTYNQELLPKEELHSLGVPHGHPVVRSFLGAPLLDRTRTGHVLGGLLLGHYEPDQFTQEDETLLVGLAAQAAVAVENARLYRVAEMRAQELHTIFEGITDGVLLADPQGKIVRENSTARHLRESLEKLPQGEHAIDLLLHTPVRLVLDGEVVKDLSVRVAAGSNGAREYLVSASPLYRITTPPGPLYQVPGSAAQHRVSGAIVVWHDVTEMALQEQAQKLQLQADLIELAHDAIIVRDPANVVVSWNRGAERLYGWTAQEALGKDIQALLRTSFPQPPEAIYSTLEQKGQWEGELTHKRYDGTSVIVESCWAMVRAEEGQPVAILEINRDITERRRIEHLERRLHSETEARRALLQMVLDELPSSVYLVRGSDARLVLANRATTTIWGATWQHDQSMSEFLQENGIRISSIDGHELAPEQFATLRAVRTGEAVYQHQEIIRHPDGKTLPVLVDAVGLDLHQLFSLPGETRQPLAEGMEPAALVVHQDVTALKEAERVKDEFIAIAAHELRNPLAALKGYAQTLLYQNQQGRGSKLAAWQREALQDIDRSTRRLVELTEDLLDATRLQAGRLELYPEPVDLVALARRIVKRFQATTEQHHLSVLTALDYLVVSIDPGRIEQVLGNLVNNAIKFSPEGGPIEVSVWEKSETGEAMLSVRDSGIGIPLHQRARIFGRFARAENARKIDGTGLGLYLCRALVEQHGGRIWFESAEGHGSTFFIALPRSLETVPLD